MRTAFKRLYDKGLIYRGERPDQLVPALHDGPLRPRSSITRRCMITSGNPLPVRGRLGSIEVATTRPETMLGDTAVAVHPDDER